MDIWLIPLEDHRPAGEPIQLTDHEGTDMCCEWSPEGSRIAFWSDRTGKGDIYTVTLPALTKVKP